MTTYSDRRPWMSDDQWRCAQLIAEVFGGFHHLPEFKTNGLGVRVRPHQHDLATYDFSHLTHLVMLAHVRCIRVSVTASGMRLEVHAFARDPTAAASMKGHATLTSAIARFAPSEVPSTTEEERDLARISVRMLTERVLITPKDAARYFIAKCADSTCGWSGLSRDCAGGEPIADTGDHSDIRCPVCNGDVDNGDEEVPKVNAASLEQLADAVAMNERLLGERDAFGKEGIRAQAAEKNLAAQVEVLKQDIEAQAKDLTGATSMVEHANGEREAMRVDRDRAIGLLQGLIGRLRSPGVISNSTREHELWAELRRVDEQLAIILKQAGA